MLPARTSLEFEASSVIEHSGWLFSVARELLGGDRVELEKLAQAVLSADQGTGGHLVRRSRHAVTYLLPAQLCGQADRGDVFVKFYRPMTGTFNALFGASNGRAHRVLRITQELARHGFATPVPLLVGWEPSSGRSLLAAERAHGELLPKALQQLSRATQFALRDAAYGVSLERKRALLKALGAEVARLHLAGFIHGDLTPYNVLVAQQGAVRFVFLDHDRTVKARFWRRRRQLRNLVQLGWREFEYVSRTDRMRFFKAYCAVLGLRAEKRVLRRVNAMILARRRKETRFAKLV